MPLVTLTLRTGRSPALKTTVLDAVHAALVASGVPPTDRFQRVIELDAEHFRFDPKYPDVETARSDDFALIEDRLGWSTHVARDGESVQLASHGEG